MPSTPKDNSPKTKRPRQHRRHRLLIAILLLASPLVIIGIWYGQSRVLAPMRCLSVSDLGTASVPAVADDSMIRLTCYNIAHGRGGQADVSNWTGNSKEGIRSHLGKVAKQISAQDTDILVLNETDFDCTWSQYIDQPKIIGRKTGLSYCVEQRNYDVSFPFRKYCFGNAILSRFPITETEVVRFPPLSTKEDIFAGNHDGVIATIETPFGKLRVLAVHLEYRSEDTRVECAKIISRLADASDIPLVAMGDFNSAPSFATGNRLSSNNENAVDILTQSAGFDAGRSDSDWTDYLTFPSAKPVRAIDWILITKPLSGEMPKVIASQLSDHLMVTRKIRLKQAP